MVGKSKKQVPINSELINVHCSLAWKILNFLKEVETRGAIFIKSEKQSKNIVNSFIVTTDNNKTTKYTQGQAQF